MVAWSNSASTRISLRTKKSVPGAMMERITFGVFNNGGDAYFTRYCLRANDPTHILDSIAETFNVRIVDEYDPKYHGFATQEEWDAAWSSEPSGKEKGV
jgi:hypothetical protein